jgi:glutamyl/glutaminyl-tRNA synthetase
MKNHSTKYDRFCHGISQDEVEKRIATGEDYVVRMYIPRGKTEFKDLIHGKVVFDHDTLDD